MMRALSILLIPLVAACGPAAPPPAPPPAVPEPEPARITVQHILIAFRGALKAPPEVTRSREEAGKFARELLDRVRQGEDVVVLARNHSTDPGGGKYRLVNFKEMPEKSTDIPRAQFIKPFTDIAFKLKVGEAGLVEYDEKNSPYGWHVIKRLE